MLGPMSSPVVREGRDESSGGPGRDIPAQSRLRLVVPARAENVALVRNTVSAAAEERGLPLHIVEDMRLAVTEACSNVVRHAYTDEGDMAVDVELSGPEMRVVVEDQGRGIGASTDDDGPGLGLPLIAALVSELQIERGRARGSRVSMRFAIGPA
jgi:serine/threonine-protein kinase RsbW